MCTRKLWEQRVEYAGSIPFTLSNTRNYVRFGTPTGEYKPTIGFCNPHTRRYDSIYRVSHTPGVPEQNRTLFTYPSDTDFRVVHKLLPSTIQANLILENQGYYIIDLIETNMNKPNPDEVVAEFNRFLSSREFQSVSVNVE